MVLKIIVIFIFFFIHTITDLVIGLYTAFNLSTNLLHDFLLMKKNGVKMTKAVLLIYILTGNHPSVGIIFELQGISVWGLLCVWSVLYNQD